MAQGESRARFGIDLTPLPIGKALGLFSGLYIASVAACKNLPPAAANDLRNYWMAFLVPGALLAAGLVRLLWNLLGKSWFAATLAVAVAAVPVAAAANLSTDAAYTLVYRSPAFVFPLAALAASLLVQLAVSPWTTSHAPKIMFRAGLLVVVTGVCLNIAGRASGTVTLVKGRPQSAVTLNDYVLTVVSNDGAWTRVPLPFENLPEGACRKYLEAADLSVEVEYRPEAKDSNAAPLAVSASDGTATKTLSLFYNGGFAPLEIGSVKHRVSFGPSRLTLPFEMTLDYAGDESVNAPGKPYDAAVSLTDGQSGRRWCAELRMESPVSAFGYVIRLMSVDRPWGASLAVVRRPGMGVISAGAVLIAWSGIIAVWLRWIYPARARVVLAYCRAIVS